MKERKAAAADAFQSALTLLGRYILCQIEIARALVKVDLYRIPIPVFEKQRVRRYLIVVVQRHLDDRGFVFYTVGVLYFLIKILPGQIFTAFLLLPSLKKGRQRK